MEVVKFNKPFKKLRNNYFSTIRLPKSKIKEGETYLIKAPGYEFEAVAELRAEISLKDIPEKTLMEDTGAASKAGALQILREFYPQLRPGSKVAFVWFWKVESVADKQQTIV